MVTLSNGSKIAVWSLHMSASNSKRRARQGKSAPRTEQSKGRFQRLRLLAAVVLIIAAGLVAYHNSFGGPFIYDGIPSIVRNKNIRQLWPIWDISFEQLQ